MERVDFITAFGRLLRDGDLRDRLAADPRSAAEQAGLHPDDWPAWRQLEPADVEFQAEVLLRKRLDEVRRMLPETCRALGETLWPRFHAYARKHWPAEPEAKIRDAAQFCRQLAAQATGLVCAAERNRLDFAVSGRRFAVRRVRLKNAGEADRVGLQFFRRRRDGRPMEIFIGLGW